VIRAYWVYILASRSRVLYTGVTNDLARRVHEHKLSLVPGFTQKYRVTRLVYFEEFGDIRAAIAREKQIKGWVRARKIELIEARNPTWVDLAEHCNLSPSSFIRRQRGLSS
jgi:putative endonuclease